MSYIDKNLIRGETVVYRTHLHPVIFLKAAMFFAVALICVILGAFSGKWAMGPFVIGGVIGFIGLLFGLSALTRRITSEFGVTNKRIIIKVGLGNTSMDTLLTRVEGINVDQGVLGRMLGYGSIDVRGVGGSKETFHHISNPLYFRRMVDEQISDAEGNRVSGGRMQPGQADGK
jgi:uncharacterized membrane protein YdbT with pleckstrin-like domain